MDTVHGNQGDDYFATGDDADSDRGGAGNDTIDGAIDDDTLRGNIGDDSILGVHGSDSIDGGQGNDYLDGSAPAALELIDAVDVETENDRDSIFGVLGDGALIGGDDDNTLLGGSGADLLDGGIDDDILDGGNDEDTLIGAQGNDTLNGGNGVHSIDGGADRDLIIVDSAAVGAGDHVQGGNAGDDFDTLDLSGVGAEGVDRRLTNSRLDDDGADCEPNGIDDTAEYLDGAGDVTGTMDFFKIEEVIPCFIPGTLIALPQGEQLAENLREGDRIITRDNGIQDIRWVGRKDLTGHMLARKPHMRPILVQKGSLGNGLPGHDLLLSPNHRILVNNDKTALYFEEREARLIAK